MEMQNSLKRKNIQSNPLEKKIKSKQSSLQFTHLPKLCEAIPVFQHPEIHIVSWNVNGIRSWIKKDNTLNFLNRQEIDIVCFNETKLQETHVADFKSKFSSYHYQYWSCSKKKLGYSGTAILSKVKPIRWEEGLKGHPDEGRLIVAEFHEFFLLATYVPNSGSNKFDYRIHKWDIDLREYIKSLENKGKNVIWIGDLNVINKDIDVYKLEGNEECYGGTPEERKSFQETLNIGLIDTFRHLYPVDRKYSWFNVIRKIAKSRNEGWRFDMAIISQNLLPLLKDSLIYDQITGSDHYPIELVLYNNPNSIQS